MNLIRTQGIVIHEIEHGDADKILTIFTKRLGKIQALAKGARRLKSSLMACSQFLVFSDFIFFKGREIYSINACEIIEPFYNIRNDLTRLAYGSYCSEIIKEVIQENQPSYRTLQLFLNTLFALSATDKSPELIIRTFELRLMALIGYRPYVDHCVICGKDNKTYYFSFLRSGLVCEKCAMDQQGIMAISEGTVEALRYIVKSNIKKLFSFSVNELILKELKIISEIYLKNKLDREFKTLKFIDKFNIY